MAQIPPIDDSYIDEIIKAAEAYNPALNKTQGVKLRELIKKLRDRFEQENSYINTLLTGFETILDGKINITEKGINNGVATLGADGKLVASQTPALAISETFIVASQATMLAIQGAGQGDVAIRTDVSKSYILIQSPASTLSNWQELLTPKSPVQSVNGQIGTVNLSKNDVGLGNVDNTSDANKSIGGNAATATFWGGKQADLLANSTAVTDFVTLNSTYDNFARKTTVADVRSLLGIPSGGETLQSVTDKGNNSTNGITVGAGDVGQPKGLLSYATNEVVLGSLSDHKVALWTNSTEQVSILSNGNVGIGIITPTEKLEVDGNTLTKGIIFSGGNPRFNIGNDDNKLSISETGIANRINILKSSGFVGIGTNVTPTEMLEVNGRVLGESLASNSNMYVKSGYYQYFDFLVSNNYAIGKSGESLTYLSTGGHVFNSDVTAPNFIGNATSATNWGGRSADLNGAVNYIEKVLVADGLDGKTRIASNEQIKSWLGLGTAAYQPSSAFQVPITLTTSGTGSATLTGSTLNIPVGSSFSGAYADLTGKPDLATKANVSGQVFTGEIKGPDGTAPTSYVTRQQIPALSTQGTGVLRLLEAAGSGLSFSPATGDTHLTIGNGVTHWSYIMPAGTFSSFGKGLLRITIGGINWNLSAILSKELQVEFTQGINTAVATVMESTGGGGFYNLTSVLTITSRQSGGLFYYNSNTNGLNNSGGMENRIFKGSVSGIDFSNAVTIKLKMSTLTGTSSLTVLPLTIEAASL